MASNEFKNYHPIVNFIYCVAIIGFSMVCMNPIFLCLSLFMAFLYSAMLNGQKTALKRILYLLPVILFMALLNPVFNHKGVTILTYLPDGNPLTAESVFYGAVSAVMVLGVIFWFSCYNEIMTNDKFIYLFGRIMPSFSLIFSMTLRFVPKFIKQLKILSMAQKTMGKDVFSGSIIKRIKNITHIMSSVTTWALENAVDTQDSMRARGYGLKNRTSFSIFRVAPKDIWALIFILMLSVYILIGIALDKTKFIYYPKIEYAEFTFYGLSLYLAFLLLCIMPLAIEFVGVIRWKYLERKI